jgi:hypothetical protein
VTAIVLAIAAAALAYAAACATLPFARCRRCAGAGVRMGKTRVLRRAVAKPCRRCGASGKRLRLGRRVWNRFARIRARADW